MAGRRVSERRLHPLKSLLKNADLAFTLRNKTKEFGISLENLQLDYAEAVKRSRKVSKRLTTGINTLMKRNSVDVFMGDAVLKDKSTVSVKGSDGAEQLLVGKDIIIATGASPINIPGMEADGEKIVNYRQAILQEKRPESVVIIGAGAIGMEFSTIWNSYGTKCTIVEMLPRVLPIADAEVSEEVSKAIQKDGIDVLVNHKVLSIEKTDTGVAVKVGGDEGEGD